MTITSAELKEAELHGEQNGNLATIAEPYVGKYFSQDYVRRKIIRQTDADILEEDAKIEQEIQGWNYSLIQMKQIQWQLHGMQPGMPQEGAVSSGPALGQTVVEPETEKQW